MNTPGSPNSVSPNLAPTILRLHAAAAADHEREWPHPVTLVFELTSAGDHAPVRARSARLLSIGHRALFPAEPAPGETDLDLGNTALIPGLVNAHAHLDLTHVGPQPHDPADGFMAWAERIIKTRATEPEAIAASVRSGVAKSIAGGTVVMGDIDGSRGEATAHRADLPGVSYLECFGFQEVPTAPPKPPSNGGPHVAGGLSPHAPYSVSMTQYGAIAGSGGMDGPLLCTHLAESPEEREFILHARGPMRGFLERMGKWYDRATLELQQGKPPLIWAQPILEAGSPGPGKGRWLVAHVNDCPEGGIEVLRRNSVHVAYCPRASEYFGAHEHFGPHRYRDMLDAGVNVCLGTDSIVNLDTPDRISVLDEMRLLHRRDGAEGRADPDRLFAMGTVNGAEALWLDPDGFRFKVGAALAGVIGVPLGESTRESEISGVRERVLDSQAAPIPVLLAPPKHEERPTVPHRSGPPGRTNSGARKT